MIEYVCFNCETLARLWRSFHTSELSESSGSVDGELSLAVEMDGRLRASGAFATALGVNGLQTGQTGAKRPLGDRSLAPPPGRVYKQRLRRVNNNFFLQLIHT